MNFLSAFSRESTNRLSVIIGLACCFLITTPDKTDSQMPEATEPPAISSNGTTESTSERNVPDDQGSRCDKDEGLSKNRSRFPKQPELFQPMPIPDPTEKPSKLSNDNPEIPESHIIKQNCTIKKSRTIKGRKAPASEKVDE